MTSSNILSSGRLGFPFKCLDPFLFAVYHNDAVRAGRSTPGRGVFSSRPGHPQYPKGMAETMGPDPELLKGRMIGQDFGSPSGWSMYHGSTIPGFPKREWRPKERAHTLCTSPPARPSSPAPCNGGSCSPAWAFASSPPRYPWLRAAQTRTGASRRSPSCAGESSITTTPWGRAAALAKAVTCSG